MIIITRFFSDVTASVPTDCQFPKENIFFGFPRWYKYLHGIQETSGCTPKITSLGDVWLILAAVIEMLLRVAALAAIVFVVIGGVKYITSQGQPDQTAQAKNTIINALIGLVISVGAAAIVSFIAGRF